MGTQAAIEIGPFGAILVAEAPISFALSGAVRPVTVDGSPIPDQIRSTLQPGAHLHIGPPTLGARSYLAIGGAAEKGAVTRGSSIAGFAHPSGSIALSTPPRSVLNSGPLATVAGPQAELFSEDLTGLTWQVAMEADRTGIRLQGAALPTLRDVRTMPSEPQTFGAIQVPPSGQPIIIGPDGPTLGGYPKIAVVISAHLNRLAQLLPGHSITFETVSLDAAHALRHEALAQFQRDTTWRYTQR